jgi:putative transposase
MPNPSKPSPLAKFKPEANYHIYNRTNARERLFRDDEDRRYFLGQFKKYLSDSVDAYAFCLLPNHFHFAVRIKSAATLLHLASQTPQLERTIPQQELLLSAPHEDYDYHELIERQFTRMFTAYAMYFNQRYQRNGNLFYRPFKRVAVDDDNYLPWLIYYIHQNPRKHKIMNKFLQYKWSSYSILVSDRPTALLRETVYEIFGSRPHFIAFHEGTEPIKQPEHLNLEIED